RRSQTSNSKALTTKDTKDLSFVVNERNVTASPQSWRFQCVRRPQARTSPPRVPGRSGTLPRWSLEPRTRTRAARHLHASPTSTSVDLCGVLTLYAESPVESLLIQPIHCVVQPSHIEQRAGSVAGERDLALRSARRLRRQRRHRYVARRCFSRSSLERLACD